MSDADFHELFPLGHDDTPYRKLTGDYVATASFDGERVVKVAPEALTLLAREAFVDCQHLLRPGHLAQLRAILDDPEASANDRFVAFDLLKNANIAAGKVLPMCQDTGTAIVMGKKGQQVWTGGDDAAALSEGIRRTYTETNLRYSQVAPLVDVRGGQYRRQSAGADRPLRRAGRPVQIPVHRQGRRLGQQELSVPADKGGAEPEIADQIHRREDPHARHRRLSALSPRDRDRRHLGRDEPEDRQARELPLSRQPADLRQQIRPGLSRPRFRGRGAGADPRPRHRRAVRRKIFLP